MAELNSERKGKFLHEIKAEIRLQEKILETITKAKQTNEHYEGIIKGCETQVENLEI